jgi:hypothetical protein
MKYNTDGIFTLPLRIKWFQNSNKEIFPKAW